MVEDQRLIEPVLKMSEGTGEQEQGVAAETGREPCDGGGGAAQGAGDLAMSGSGHEAGGDGDEQLGTLEEVACGEGLT